MTTKNYKEIEDLLLTFSSAEEKKEYIDVKLSKVLNDFENLYSSLEETFSKRDSEYSEAIELLIVETDKQVKGYLSDLKKGFDKKNDQINFLISDLKDKTDSSEQDLKNEIKKAQTDIKSFTRDYLKTIEEARSSFSDKVSSLILKSEKSFASVEKKTEDLKKDIDSLKKDLIDKFSALSGHGGGSMNRRISVNGTVISTRYTDINFKGSGVTYSAVNNDTTKQVDLTLTSSGGSGITKLTTASTIDDSNTVFVFTGTPTYLVINGIWYDNTAGAPYTWTGTSTVTLNQPLGTGSIIWGFA